MIERRTQKHISTGCFIRNFKDDVTSCQNLFKLLSPQYFNISTYITIQKTFDESVE